MAELYLDERELTNISLALGDRELILRHMGNHHAANHFQNLAAKWDTFLVETDLPHSARLVVDEEYTT